MWVSISTGHTQFCELEPICAWKRTKFHPVWELWMLPQTAIDFTIPYHFITPLKWHGEENNSLVTCKLTTDTLLYSNCNRIYNIAALNTSEQKQNAIFQNQFNFGCRNALRFNFNGTILSIFFNSSQVLVNHKFMTQF